MDDVNAHALVHNITYSRLHAYTSVSGGKSEIEPKYLTGGALLAIIGFIVFLLTWLVTLSRSFYWTL